MIWPGNCEGLQKHADLSAITSRLNATSNKPTGLLIYPIPNPDMSAIDCSAGAFGPSIGDLGALEIVKESWGEDGLGV